LTTLAAWAPVWVPAIFLGQLVLSGALPARAERARLERAEGRCEFAKIILRGSLLGVEHAGDSALVGVGHIDQSLEI
jgi:hypothetical protein